LEENYKKLQEAQKMSDMGSMIGNIAHQWRQPLSVISTASTGMIMKKEHDMLNDASFFKTCNQINESAQFLSKTIDDFRNFIKGDSTKKIFNLQENIFTFMSLVDGTIKSNNIKVVLNLQEDIQLNSSENELIQCLINVFNNAKDALVEKDVDNKLILISTSIENKNVLIKIKDNAGGIPADILPSIFDPYFTTKHESMGTGIGLNMTYNLITNSMNGTIEATNIEFEYDNNNYIGAEFTIEIPISQPETKAI